jgi:hypothetical protein
MPEPHGPPRLITPPALPPRSPSQQLPMVRLIGDDDSEICRHMGQPPQPVQLSGEPLFRVVSVNFEFGHPCATVVLDSVCIQATAERVSLDVVEWLRQQGPEHRVTLSQLYSPVPPLTPPALPPR